MHALPSAETPADCNAPDAQGGARQTDGSADRQRTAKRVVEIRLEAAARAAMKSTEDENARTSAPVNQSTTTLKTPSRPENAHSSTHTHIYMCIYSKSSIAFRWCVSGPLGLLVWRPRPLAGARARAGAVSALSAASWRLARLCALARPNDRLPHALRSNRGRLRPLAIRPWPRSGAERCLWCVRRAARRAKVPEDAAWRVLRRGKRKERAGARSACHAASTAHARSQSTLCSGSPETRGSKNAGGRRGRPDLWNWARGPRRARGLSGPASHRARSGMWRGPLVADCPSHPHPLPPLPSTPRPHFPPIPAPPRVC